MKHRRNNRKKASGAPKWMVTYSDMVTLILVFFILLFSMSQIDLVKFETISESFRNRMIFDFNASPVPLDDPTDSTDDLDSGKDSKDFDELIGETAEDLADKLQELQEKDDALNTLMEDIGVFLDTNELNDVITASRTERGVILVLQESILFDSGEAEILESGKPFLNKIGELLIRMPNPVKVEGHTDSRRISNYRYPSNWELSGGRASSVIRYLIEENDFEVARFSSVGYGDTRPIAPNDTAENWSKNRRVEMVILDGPEYEDDIN